VRLRGGLSRDGRVFGECGGVRMSSKFGEASGSLLSARRIVSSSLGVLGALQIGGAGPGATGNQS
jgi:hypothetical protein